MKTTTTYIQKDSCQFCFLLCEMKLGVRNKIPVLEEVGYPVRNKGLNLSVCNWAGRARYTSLATKIFLLPGYPVQNQPMPDPKNITLQIKYFSGLIWKHTHVYKCTLAHTHTHTHTSNFTPAKNHSKFTIQFFLKGINHQIRILREERTAIKIWKLQSMLITHNSRQNNSRNIKIPGYEWEKLIANLIYTSESPKDSQMDNTRYLWH